MRSFIGAAVLALVATSAQAHLTEIRVQKVEPFANGRSFGNVGAYERVSGVAKGELDPRDERNRRIVNLDRTTLNARGRVEYEVDWFMLRPADAAKGNGRILYDVTNRGRKFLLHWLMDAPARPVGELNDPKTVESAGNALFFRLGYTMVWSGWDAEAPRTGNGMAMSVPNARDITRTIRDELVNGTRGPRSDTFRLSHQAATLDQAEAKLTMRRKEKDPKVEVPASRWAFVNAREIRLVDAKPEPGTLYEFHYVSKDPKVQGIGFAAVRDLVSFLRYESSDREFMPNPAGRGIEHALAVGISQSGRFLRDFVHQGFNQDEAKRKVFDGALSHIAGVGGVFLNAEFAQPARTNTQHEDHTYPENAFPFSAAKMRDPVTRRSGALLRGDGFDPLWMDVNTSTEYWQKAASLLHTDTLGRQDVALPANARAYLVAGTQHGGRNGLKPDFGPCANPRNPHSPAPALRALIVALDEWVSKGTPPPASRVPTFASRTLVATDRTGFPAIPGMHVASFGNELALYGDWVHPREVGPTPYRAFVSRVDRDGNEVAGIRLPDIAVPLATHTGWNLYKAPFPEGELCDRDGSYDAFPSNAIDRKQKGDPRASLAERYPSYKAYYAKVEAETRKLVRARLLLQEDADIYLRAARDRRW